MYAWSERTLARRLQYFEIKFTTYEVDIEDVKEADTRNGWSGTAAWLSFHATKGTRDSRAKCAP